MVYKNKTIQKHTRGNWFARVRHSGKIISIYGRTQLEAYAKLKALVDRIESEKAALSGGRLLRRVDGLAVPSVGAVAVAVVEGAGDGGSAQGKGKRTYTLREWYDEWISSYKAGHVRAATLTAFRSQFRKLKSLYDVRIDEITNLMLSKAINEVSANRAKDAVHNLLKQLFAVAFNNRLIEVNPAASLPRPKQAAIHQKRAFTQEQERRFIELCLTDSDFEPFIICVLQGLRKGEMLALKPNDFNFENGTLRIDESYDQAHPEDMQTKNQASNRIMPMFALTRKILLRYRDADPKERIFRLTDTMVQRRLARLYKLDADLPRLTTHELRHTFISRCHEKGIDEIVVQRWVGHAIGSRMTKAVYTHVADDAERRYIDILNGVID